MGRWAADPGPLHILLALPCPESWRWKAGPVGNQRREGGRGGAFIKVSVHSELPTATHVPALRVRESPNEAHESLPWAGKNPLQLGRERESSWSSIAAGYLKNLNFWGKNTLLWKLCLYRSEMVSVNHLIRGWLLFKAQAELLASQGWIKQTWQAQTNTRTQACVRAIPIFTCTSWVTVEAAFEHSWGLSFRSK